MADHDTLQVGRGFLLILKQVFPSYLRLPSYRVRCNSVLFLQTQNILAADIIVAVDPFSSRGPEILYIVLNTPYQYNVP